MRKGRKPYRIIGAYDSETSNITEGIQHRAFPVLHQLGLLDGTYIEQVDSSNVEGVTNVHLYRHALEFYAKLDELVECEFGYVPVICCHNLAFDMYGLAPWLDSQDNIRVLAKSKRKPITFTIQDEDGNARLVLWDTLVFSGQGLDKMGRDCNYLKASGKWDYLKIRTPETPLTDDEIEYSKKDIYALLAWLGWWLRRNPDIEPSKLALNVVTKTGVVRERRKVRFDQVKGHGNKYNVGRFWNYLNRSQLPKTDDELYMMHAATRGGLTFCASSSASVPFDLVGTDYTIAGFDATSQHPAQMVSHVYPVNFHETSPENLGYAFRRVCRRTLDEVLDRWDKPFPVAFYAAFEFENLRVKPDSIYGRNGIAPLASARVTGSELKIPDYDNESGQNFKQFISDIGYKDTCVNPRFEFGKLVSADRAVLYITELTAWEISRCYDFDRCIPLHGYLSTRFQKPSDMSVISVMQFYKAKNEFKKAREHYYKHGTITNGRELEAVGIPHSVVSSMENGTISDSDVDAQYLQQKSDLNALFGIEASNEHRQDTVLTSNGIEYVGGFSVENSPKNPKAWYQFGQRIVGWSRIAQIVVMELGAPYVERIVNGDTDSVKFLMHRDKLPALEKALSRYGRALDDAKDYVCSRVRKGYPQLFDPLGKIGHYVLEFEVDRFCASWNKAYCMHEVDPRDGRRKFAFTLAGIPARRGVNQCADQLFAQGRTFSEICDIMLGYNVTYTHSVIQLNARSFPTWGDTFYSNVEDYEGNEARVIEPAALALYPMSKVVNDTLNRENLVNARIAAANNGNVNLDHVLVSVDRPEVGPPYYHLDKLKGVFDG